MQRLASALTFLILAGCTAPAPEPIAIARVRALRITPNQSRVCPGTPIEAHYTAVIDDASLRPIEESAVLGTLELTGVAAQPRTDGGWDTDPDPLVSAATGFHLHAALRENRAISADTIIVPQYDCHPVSLWLATRGAPHPGPDVSVRVSQLRTPFYDSVALIAINVEDRPTMHVLLGPSQFQRGTIRISADGGAGAQGRQGATGLSGTSACADGGDGTNGQDGEPGGSGGQFTVYVQDEHQGLLDLIQATNSGGRGGPGGRGGYGGRPGPPSGNPPCSPRAGKAGTNGRAGDDGRNGAPWRVRALPLTELWQLSPTWTDDNARKALSALIDQTLRLRAP